jgi:hypothetical protein
MTLRRIDVLVAAGALLLLIVLLLLLSSTPARAATTLEQGIKRETALLQSEKEALRRERARIDAEHQARIATERASIAVLEARLVEATARTAARAEALRTAIEGDAHNGPPGAGGPSPATTRDALRKAFAVLGLTPPVADHPSGSAPLLAAAVERLQQRGRPVVVESGFFDADGAFVQGRVVQWGGLAWAAAAATAGPLRSLDLSSDGARQLVDNASTGGPALVTENARAFVSGSTPAVLPVFVAEGTDADDAGVVVLVGFTERLRRLGTAGVALLVVLVAAFIAALLPLLRVWQAHRAVGAVAGRLPALVQRGEIPAAAALARTIPGVPGAFVQSVVAAATRRHPDDEVAALSGEVGFALDRAVFVAHVAAVTSAATVVVVTARTLAVAVEGLLGTADVPVRAVLDALAGALLPVELGALVTIPWALLLLVARGGVARAKERLDVLALRVLDAVERVG